MGLGPFFKLNFCVIVVIIIVIIMISLPFVCFDSALL